MRRLAGILQALNVLFDMGMCSHGGVQVNRVSSGVGVEAPSVAELETREQAALRTEVEGLPSNDESGSFGQLVVGDQRGQLAHRGADPWLALLGDGRLPHLVDADGITNGCRHLGIRACRHEEGGVTRPAGGEEPFGAPGRVGPDYDTPGGHTGVVIGSVTRGDGGGQLGDGLVKDGDMVGHGVGARVARTKEPESVSPVASAKQNMGWNPNPPL
jgi:hypothetical protein